MMPPDHPPGGDGVKLSELRGIVRRHQRPILLAAALGVCAAGVVIFTEPRLYRATAVVRLTDPRRSIVQGLEDRPDRTAEQRVSILQSEIQLLRSRALIGAVIDTHDLRFRNLRPGRLPREITGFRAIPDADEDTLSVAFGPSTVSVHTTGGAQASASYGDTIRLPGVQFVVTARPRVEHVQLMVASRERLIDWLLGSLKVAPRSETDVVDVSFSHTDPDIAQRVVNTLVKTFQQASIRAAQAQSRRRREFLGAQLVEIDLQLGRFERSLVDFRSKQHVYSARAQMEAQQSALMALDIRRQELDASRRSFQSLLDRLSSSAAQSSDVMQTLAATPELNVYPAIGQLYEKLAQYQSTRDSLTTGPWRSASTNPDVTRLDTLIATAQGRLVGAVRGHVSTLDASLAALNSLRDRSTASIAALPTTESAETRLVRQVETSRAMDDRLREEYQKARMAEEVEAGRVEVVDLAERPYKPVQNLVALKLALGLVAGLLAGGVIALLRERASPAIRKRADLESEMGISALAIIPNIHAPSSFDGRSGLASLLAAARRGVKRNHLQIATTPDRPLGSLAGNEAYRLLHASLQWLQGTQPLKTIVVASAFPQEGKSTVAANLALIFALEGQRTLLIDADLRRPRLHRAFRIPRAPGLAQCLGGYVTPAGAVRTTFLDTLFILPAGQADATPANVFRAQPLKKLLAEVADRFDVIIIDTPPVFAAADSAIVGPLADGVLFVVRAGRTERQAAQQAFQQLTSVGAHILGAVLNDPNGEAVRYGEYYPTHGYADTYVGPPPVASHA